jgi:hypothetical protein
MLSTQNMHEDSFCIWTNHTFWPAKPSDGTPYCFQNRTGLLQTFYSITGQLDVILQKMILIYREYFYFVDLVHGSTLRSGWCSACCEVHMNFAHESACLMANNVWNEGK